MSVELLSINSYSCILNLSANLKEQTGFTLWTYIPVVPWRSVVSVLCELRECTVRNTCCKYRIDSVTVSYISANPCDSSSLVALGFSITLVWKNESWSWTDPFSYSLTILQESIILILVWRLSLIILETSGLTFSMNSLHPNLPLRGLAPWAWIQRFFDTFNSKLPCKTFQHTSWFMSYKLCALDIVDWSFE